MPSEPPIAVQFGAGNIGRGFMGELFWRSGYRTCFVEIDPSLVEALNRRGRYTIHHVTNEGDEAVTVAGVSAIGAGEAEAVARAVAQADLACTAVGVRALEAVAPALAAGISCRMAAGHKRPLNTITCENLVGAGRRLRDLVWQALRRQAAAGGPTPDELLRWHGHPAHDSRAGSPCHLRAAFDARFGFAEAVVSRMVPIVPEEVRRRDPLWIASEPYARLPVDGRAFRGPVPPIVGLEPVDPILAHQRRKLASHNMSHAVCAYLGHLAGHAFLWQAVSDAAIFADVRGAVDETGRALIRRFGFRPDEQRAYEDDLLGRYRNRALGDQVRRVAADPLRKLGPDDRLIGSASLCLEEGIEPVHVLKGVRAALRYDRADDPSAVRLQEMRRTRGLAAVLEAVCGLRPGGPLFERIIAADGAE